MTDLSSISNSFINLTPQELQTKDVKKRKYMSTKAIVLLIAFGLVSFIVFYILLTSLTHFEVGTSLPMSICGAVIVDCVVLLILTCVMHDSGIYNARERAFLAYLRSSGAIKTLKDGLGMQELDTIKTQRDKKIKITVALVASSIICDVLSIVSVIIFMNVVPTMILMLLYPILLLVGVSYSKKSKAAKGLQSDIENVAYSVVASQFQNYGQLDEETKLAGRKILNKLYNFSQYESYKQCFKASYRDVPFYYVEFYSYYIELNHTRSGTTQSIIPTCDNSVIMIPLFYSSKDEVVLMDKDLKSEKLGTLDSYPAFGKYNVVKGSHSQSAIDYLVPSVSSALDIVDSVDFEPAIVISGDYLCIIGPDRFISVDNVRPAVDEVIATSLKDCIVIKRVLEALINSGIYFKVER